MRPGSRFPLLILAALLGGAASVAAASAWCLGFGSLGPVRTGMTVEQVLRLADWPGLGERALHEGRDLRPTLDMRALFKAALIAQLSLDEAVLEARVFPGSAGVRPLVGLFA